MAHPVEFLFCGNVVGEFRFRPKGDGLVEYMPYRGIGHSEMQEALSSGSVVECELAKKLLKKNKQNIKRSSWVFNVISCPEYGVLEIVNFHEKI